MSWAHVHLGSTPATPTYSDTYLITDTAPTPTGTHITAAIPKYAWSNKSRQYHLAKGRFVQNTAPENLENAILL
jgi:hypothetical protein